MRTLSPFNDRRFFARSPFDEIFTELEKSLSPSPSLAQAFTPALDVEEKEGTYLVTIDIPGIKKDEIQISLNDKTLTVSGERTKEVKGQGHHFERNYGRFTRSLTLPENVKADAIEAHYEDGVLKVAIPKVEAKKPQTIPVQTGKGGSLLEKFFGAKSVEATDSEEKH